MNKLQVLSALAVLATLGGCATGPDDGYGYGYGRQSGDPSQWRVVSVTPVPAGTGERIARESGSGSSTEYSSTPVYETVPVAPAPVYAPEPAYVYPPVTFSLGLMLGHSWGGHRHHGRGGGHRRHR